MDTELKNPKLESIDPELTLKGRETQQERSLARQTKRFLHKKVVDFTFQEEEVDLTLKGKETLRQCSFGGETKRASRKKFVDFAFREEEDLLSAEAITPQYTQMLVEMPASPQTESLQGRDLELDMATSSERDASGPESSQKRDEDAPTKTLALDSMKAIVLMKSRKRKSHMGLQVTEAKQQSCTPEESLFDFLHYNRCTEHFKLFKDSLTSLQCEGNYRATHGPTEGGVCAVSVWSQR